MAYPQERKRVGRLGGIVLLAVLIIVIAMALFIGFITLGAIFSAFDNMTGLLNTPALAVYTFLRATAADVFSLMGIILIVAGIGSLVIAIFALRSGRES